MRMSSSRYVSASFMDLRFTLGELAIRSHSAFSGVAITNAYPSFSMLDSPIEMIFLGCMYIQTVQMQCQSYVNVLASLTA